MNKSDIRRSWGIILLWMFFIPLFSNNLHYVIIKHEYGKTNSNQLEWSDGNNIHYCNQHLFKLLPAIQVPTEFRVETLFETNFQSVFTEPPVFYVINVNKVFFTRGPPSII